jgi:hypothetical protein
MKVRIRKCANPKCSELIGVLERPNKKYCSLECKNKTHNDRNSKNNMSWAKVLDKYHDLPSEPFVPFPRWLEQNYYPPKEIKIKKNKKL